MLPIPKDDVIFRRLADGAVVLHGTEEIYYGLNDAGARIWELLPTCASCDQLWERLCAESPGVDAATIRADAQALIADLLHFGLLTARAPDHP